MIARSEELSLRVSEAVFHLLRHKDRKKVMNPGIQFQVHQNILVHSRDFLLRSVRLLRDVSYAEKMLQVFAPAGIRTPATDRRGV
jgi:hypothetical protein